MESLFYYYADSIVEQIHFDTFVLCVPTYIMPFLFGDYAGLPWLRILDTVIITFFSSTFYHSKRGFEI